MIITQYMRVVLVRTLSLLDSVKQYTLKCHLPKYYAKQILNLQSVDMKKSEQGCLSSDCVMMIV